jgi:hypothetical protein
MNPNIMDTDIEEKYKKFIAEIDEQFKRDLEVHDMSFMKPGLAAPVSESKPLVESEPKSEPEEENPFLSQWRANYLKNDISGYKGLEVPIDCDFEKVKSNRSFNRQARKDKLICQNRNFLFLVVEPFIYIKAHDSDKIEKIDFLSPSTRTDSKLEFEEIYVSDHFQNDYIIMFKKNARISIFLLINQDGNLSVKRCPMTINQTKAQNFVWKKNKVYFHSENEIQQLEFRSTTGDFVNEIANDFFVYSKVLSLTEPFVYYDVSYVYDLFYVLNNDRIFVYNNVNCPIHVFKPLLDETDHILCIKSFRRYLPVKSTSEEDSKDYFKHNDFIVAMTNNRKLLVFDVGQMSSGNENIFKIDEFDLEGLFSMHDLPNDFKEFSFSSNSDLLYIKSKELDSIFFLKVNPKYINCFSATELCLNVGERLRADSRTISSKPFFPGTVSKDNSLVKGKRSSVSTEKKQDGNRRIYHTFFEYASCQVIPHDSLSCSLTFVESKKNTASFNIPAPLEDFNINILSRKMVLSEFKLTVGILDYYKSTKELSVNINLSQKFDKIDESLVDQTVEANKEVSVQENEKFPPEMPEIIKLLCQKSKDKKEQDSNPQTEISNTNLTKVDIVQDRDVSSVDNKEKEVDMGVSDPIPQSLVPENESANIKQDSSQPGNGKDKVEKAQNTPITPEPSDPNKTKSEQIDLVNIPILPTSPIKQNVVTNDEVASTVNKVEPAQVVPEIDRQGDKIENIEKEKTAPVSKPEAESEENKTKQAITQDSKAQEQLQKERTKKRELKAQKQSEAAFAQSLSDLLMAFHDKITGTVSQFSDEFKKNITKEVQTVVQNSLKDANKQFNVEFTTELEKIISAQIDKHYQKLTEKFGQASEKVYQSFYQKMQSQDACYGQLVDSFKEAFQAHIQTVDKINTFIGASKETLTASITPENKIVLTEKELGDIKVGLQLIKDNQKTIKEKLSAMEHRVMNLEINKPAHMPPITDYSHNTQSVPNYSNANPFAMGEFDMPAVQSQMNPNFHRSQYIGNSNSKIQQPINYNPMMMQRQPMMSHADYMNSQGLPLNQNPQYMVYGNHPQQLPRPEQLIMNPTHDMNYSHGKDQGAPVIPVQHFYSPNLVHK